MENNSLNEIAKVLKNKNSFLIISHKFPDGDTIGANFALSLCLKKLNKKVISYCEHKIPEVFEFLLTDDIKFTTSVEDIKNEKFDSIVAVDASDERRFSEFEKIKNLGEIIINIDHHKSNEFFGHFNFVDLNASATSEIIYDLIKILEIDIDKDIAKAIYTGIITDTGSFRYSNTTKKCFHIAGELLSKGINAWEISEKIYENYPFKRIKLLSEALNSIELLCNNKVALMSLNYETLKKYNADFDDTDGFVNYGRSIKGVELSIFIKEDENGCKLSFRSKGNVDASKIAEKFGGGGHFNAAGAYIEKSINETEKIIKKTLKNFNI